MSLKSSYPTKCSFGSDIQKYLKCLGKKQNKDHKFVFTPIIWYFISIYKYSSQVDNIHHNHQLSGIVFKSMCCISAAKGQGGEWW